MSFEGRIDFVGIGAQKCGTTWLHTQLSRHPDVWVPADKELHFFDKIGGLSPRFWPYGFQQGDVEKTFYLAASNGLNLVFGEKEFTDSEYLANFKEADPANVIGEITPAYAMLHPRTVKKIQDLKPDLKVLFNVKNPAVRAYGNAINRLQKKSDKPLIQDDIKATETWLIRTLAEYTNLGKSLFSNTLSNWTSYFPIEQIFVIDIDRIENSPRDVMKDVALHIGVDPAFFDTVNDEAIGARIHPSAVTSADAFTTHPPTQRIADLLKEIYVPEIRRLEAILRRDFSHWIDELESMPVQ